MDLTVLVGNLALLGDGLVRTLEMAVLAFAGALVLGTFLGVLRVSPIPPLRAAGTAYVEVVRNIPLLALLVLFVFALPKVGVTYPLFTTAVIVIALYEAAYICEAVRSGVNAVPVGQVEAGRALGLTFGQSLRHVVLPQAMRTVVQPIGNVFISLTLNTSLAAAVGVVELTGSADRLNLRYAQPLVIFFGAGLAYIVVTFLIGQLTGVLERRVAIHR